nr:AraC family transcriptional regulator [Shimwellia pseudoproteus]
MFAAQVAYCEPHWHPAPELITVLSGAFWVVADQQEYLLTAGDRLYLSAETVHTLSARQPDSRLITVQFSPALFDALHPAPRLDYCTAGRPLGTGDEQVARCLGQLLESVVAGNAPFMRIATTYLLLNALQHAGKMLPQAGVSTRDMGKIKRGIGFINGHFDGPLTLQQVADHVGMSYGGFSRLFARISRCTFREYLTVVRLNKARMLLRDTRIPITDIALMSGFRQHKLLIAAFNKHHGVTPTGYRKQALSPADPTAHGGECVYLALNDSLRQALASGLAQRQQQDTQ